MKGNENMKSDIKVNKEETNKNYKTGSIKSKDSTIIGYRQLGYGPGIVLVHGAMTSAQNFTQLAEYLSNSFTVYIPDRRGRGLSGQFGKDYSMQSEVEDLEAILNKTGANNVFGISSGGLIVLQAALSLPMIHKAAIYEPALLLNGSDYTDWLDRYDMEMSQGKVASALITSMKGLKLGPPIFNLIPRWILEFLTNKVMESEDKNASAGEVTMRMLAPTLHFDGKLLVEMEGTIERFSAANAEFLLLGGSKGLSYLKPSLLALEKVLPHAKRIELQGLDHSGACNINNSNRGGNPELVSQELRRFFL
jgi:pimeloyl-ACP methyl ester carboxylesterase